MKNEMLFATSKRKKNIHALFAWFMLSLLLLSIFVSCCARAQAPAGDDGIQDEDEEEDIPARESVPVGDRGLEASSSDLQTAKEKQQDATQLDQQQEQQQAPQYPGSDLFEAAISTLLVEANLTKVIDLLRAAADKGHPDAQSKLAVFFAYGIGVPRSEAKAVLFHYFAAAGGSVESNLALAHRYEHGIGVPTSCNEAVKHAKVAADFVARTYVNDIRARIDNTLLEEEAQGGGSGAAGGAAGAQRQMDRATQQEIVQVHQYRAEKGVAMSHMFLGYCYMLGLHGIQQDGHRAVKHFEAAAKVGEAAAYGALGQIFSQGVSTAEPPIPVDLHKAHDYFSKGASAPNRHPVSLNGLGYMYARGVLVQRDFKKAAEYFDLSATQGNAEANYNLGVLYLNGRGKQRDSTLASTHLLKAATQGSVLANWQLGNMNLIGLGNIPKSCPTALRNFKLVHQRGSWHQRSHSALGDYQYGDYTSALLEYLVLAELGSHTARRNAVYILHQGHGFEHMQVMKNGKLASKEEARGAVLLSLIQRSADLGDSAAHLKLADAFYYGSSGADADMQKAEEHYLIAAKGRNAQAVFNLGLIHSHTGPKQDFHLAKRYFDEALELNPSAFYAVKLALFRLNAQWWSHHFLEGGAEARGSAPASTPNNKPPPPAAANNNKQQQQQAKGGQGVGIKKVGGLRSYLVLPAFFGYTADTILVAGLIVLLVALLLMRHHALMHLR